MIRLTSVIYYLISINIALIANYLFPELQVVGPIVIQSFMKVILILAILNLLVVERVLLHLLMSILHH